MYKIIKKFRQACNMTQKEFAEKAGIGTTTLTKLESGEKSNISLETFTKIAKALGLKTNEFMMLCELVDEEIGEQAVLEKYVQLQRKNRQDEMLACYMMGKTLKAIRIAEQQNIAKLALTLDTVPSILEKIEMCEMKPTWQMLAIYIKIFNISEEKLYELLELETEGASFKEILAAYLQNQD